MNKYIFKKQFIVFLILLGCSLTTNAYAATWSFAVISDTHDSDKQYTEVGVTPALPPIVDFIIKQKVDFVIETGDLITGTLTEPESPVCEQFDKQYKNYLDMVSALTAKNIPLYVTRGNHDYGQHDEIKACTQAYMSLIAPLMPQTGPPGERGVTYSIVHNNSRFIIMDQYTNASNETITLNLAWLKQELIAGEKNNYIFVFGHSPAFSPNVDTDKEHWNLYQSEQIRDEFWQMLTDARNVVAYVSGHKHLYCRGLVNGVYQIINGNLGTLTSFDPHKSDKQIEAIYPAQKVSENKNWPGCLIITIDDDKNLITVKEYRFSENGMELNDSFMLTNS